MRLRSHPGARRDFNLAVDWYIAEAGKPTAARFVEEVDYLRSLILDNPRIGTPGRSDTRSFVFKRFPYTLIYRVRGDVLEVLALADLKARALRLTPPDRDELIRALIASIDGEPEGSPEEIARAWDEEIERRIADLDSGRTVGIPAEHVLAEIRAMIAGHGKS